jgi:predicted acetyltransferase
MYKFYKPSTDEDIKQIYQLMRTVFKSEEIDRLVKNLIENHPEITLDNLFCILDDGKIIASLIMIPQTWIVDGLEIKVAEMGCVATHPEYRGRGLQHILNEKFDNYASNNGFDLCALAGIPYFYRQFGYEYSVELDHMISLSLSAIQSKEVTKFRRFDVSDIQAASELLVKSQKRYFIKQKRTRDIWEIQQSTMYYKGEPFEAYSLRDAEGLLAYLRLRQSKKEKTLYLNEACVRDPEACEQVLNFIKSFGRRGRLEKLVSRLSYEDDLSQQLLNFGANQSRPYAWQVKIIDYLEMFKRIAPLLERRLKASQFSGLDEILNFNFRKFTINLKISKGVVEEVRKSDDCTDRTIGLNPYIFPQLLLGYKSREELEFAYPDFSVRETHKELIDTLFPTGPGYIHYVY